MPNKKYSKCKRCGWVMQGFNPNFWCVCCDGDMKEITKEEYLRGN